MKYNTVEDIADEYGIPFIDYNEVYNEMGLDFATDHADEGHMNYKGVRKFTDYFADYIRDEYSLIDHRNEEFFASGDDNAYYMDAFYESMYIKDSMTWNDWIANISTSQNLDINFILSKEGECDKEDPKLQKLFDELKISEVKEASLWICEVGMPVVIGSDWEYRDWGVDTFKIRSGQDGINSIFMNRDEVNMVDNGVNIIIYSNTLEKVVDVVGIDCGDGYQLVR